MTRREAQRVAALVRDAVRPGGALPPVEQTDAVVAFGTWLERAPRVNRLAIRAALHAGIGHDVLRRLAAHCYYGDADVMRRLGYDADAVVERARAAPHGGAR